METVSYVYRFDYSYDDEGERFQKLLLQIASPGHPEHALEIDAYLDSGAERTLVDGRIGTALGLDLLSGPELRCVSITGTGLTARLHVVRFSHPDLGDFELEVGFTTVPISRHLLGRDFFNLIQIGFRERQLTFYVIPTP